MTAHFLQLSVTWLMTDCVLLAFLTKLFFIWSKVLTQIKITDRMEFFKNAKVVCPLSMLTAYINLWGLPWVPGSWCLEKSNTANQKLPSSVFIANLEKIIKKNLFNSTLNLINTKNILSAHEPGCRYGDSCVHQFTSTVYEIYIAFDTSPRLGLRVIFLKNSTVFDRV